MLAVQGSHKAPPQAEPHLPDIPGVAAHPPLAPVAPPVTEALMKQIADTHKVALETLHEAVESAEKAKDKKWIQIIAGQEKRKFLLHYSAENATYELYLIIREIGEGTSLRVQEIVSLNTGQSAALKLAKNHDAESFEEVTHTMMMIDLINKEGRHNGLPGRLPYHEPCQFADENNVTQMGWIEELFDGNADLKPAKTKKEFATFTSNLTEGVLFLHQHHIFHRDIKNLNIFVRGDYTYCELNDFGAAKLFSEMEKEFQEEYQKYSEAPNEKKQQTGNESLNYLLAETLTPGFWNPNDGPALAQAFVAGDHKKFIETIGEKREIFALGATIICNLNPDHFYVNEDPNHIQTILDTPDPNDPLWPTMSHLTTSMCHRFIFDFDLDIDQIRVIDHMLSDSYEERPSAQAVYDAFHPKPFDWEKLKAELQALYGPAP